MNNIEQYQNLVELLKKALEFYADERNYAGYMGNPASIDLDEHGSQARFALAKLKETTDAQQKMEDDYNKIMKETIEAIESHPFDIRKEIDMLKNIGDDNNV